MVTDEETEAGKRLGEDSEGSLRWCRVRPPGAGGPGGGVVAGVRESVGAAFPAAAARGRAGPLAVRSCPAPAPPPVRPLPRRPCRDAGVPLPSSRGAPSSLQHERPRRDPYLRTRRELQPRVAGGARGLRCVGLAPADPGQAGDGALGDPLHARAGGRRRLQR